MRKVLFLLAFLLITAANTAVVSAITDDERICMPIGDPEENSGEEETRNISEDDNDVCFDHRWLSLDKSSDSNLHIVYQDILFKDLELEVVVPPPKA